MHILVNLNPREGTLISISISYLMLTFAILSQSLLLV
uniref:Uncharacterized protein n=1 Tax=Setaria italica TaxID=4555 RepID=K3Y4K0_SETIT